MSNIIQQIEEQIKELGASTDIDANSGLMVEDLGNGRVKIYDDTTSGEGDAVAMLEALKQCQPVKWEDDDGPDPWGPIVSAFEAIWSALTDAGLEA
jgi:hypothetical protein